jgi:hypothetical protein
MDARSEELIGDKSYAKNSNPSSKIEVSHKGKKLLFQKKE